MESPPTITIKTQDFNIAWSLSLHTAMHRGMVIPECPLTEKPNVQLTMDMSLLTELTGAALEQILNSEMHNAFPQKNGVYSYEQQFIEGSDEWKRANDAENGFDYTYWERLCKYTIGEIQTDQLKYICENLNAFDRRLQAITWNVEKDLGSEKSTPCLQLVQLRNLGNGHYQIWLTWRSRDLYRAWQSNLIGLLKFIDLTVKKYHNLQLIKVEDRVNSAHVYEENWDEALRVPVMASWVNKYVTD